MNNNKKEQDKGKHERYLRWQAVPIVKKLTAFTVRLPKKDMQRLRFIVSESGLSMNSICLLGIRAYTQKLLKDFDEDERCDSLRETRD